MGKKKKIGLGMAAIAASAGVATYAVKNYKKAQNTPVIDEAKEEYRNTERGKNEKNSKGIYYSNGNYEAFARPKKPEGVEDKQAYIVGSGLAALAKIFTFWKQWILQAVHVMVFLILQEVM